MIQKNCHIGIESEKQNNEEIKMEARISIFGIVRRLRE
jgi:hypothetical protein